MGIVIGIDVGGSTTKIVGINGEQIQSPMFITATDPVTSLFGAFGKYIYDNGIQLADVEQVMLTGVGSAFVNSPLYGLPTRKTDEFIANGLGSQTCNGYRPTDCSQHGYRHFFCENRRRQGAAYWRLGDWWRYLAGIIEVAVENS